MIPLKTAQQRAMLEALFAGQRENLTMLQTYFQGYGGMGWADRPDAPRVGLIRVGDFGFLAGDAACAEARTLAESLCSLAGFWILTPPDTAWTALLREVWGERAQMDERYAIRHDTAFDREKLRRCTKMLPLGVHLEEMNAHWFEVCRRDEVFADFVSNFRNWVEFSSYAVGVLAVRDGEVLGGASTYTRFDGVEGYRYGLELEVDTKPAYRRQGIATASAAAMILACLDRGIYPAWDAASRASVALAEKLGYREKGSYPVVRLS